MLQIKDLSFSYPQKQVLTHFDLELGQGEILALMGPSGCGKSTLLQLISGLLKPQSGQILCHAKKISYAFQEPRLFPWMNIRENLLLVSRNKEEEISPLLASLGLENTEKLMPDELSGGMKSRVSLARALLNGGDLYLLDEPFSALDEERITIVLPLLKKQIQNSGASALFVTHRAEEAMALADRIFMFE